MPPLPERFKEFVCSLILEAVLSTDRRLGYKDKQTRTAVPLDLLEKARPSLLLVETRNNKHSITHHFSSKSGVECSF